MRKIDIALVFICLIIGSVNCHFKFLSEDENHSAHNAYLDRIRPGGKSDFNRLTQIINDIENDIEISDGNVVFIADLMNGYMKSQVKVQNIINLNRVQNKSKQESFLEYNNKFNQLELLIEEMNKEKISFEVNKKKEIEAQSNLNDSILCKPCHLVVKKIDKFIQSPKIEEFLKNTVISICHIILDETVCHDAIYRYFDVIYDNFLSHYLEPEFICTKAKVCDNHYEALEADEFARNLLKNKPAKKDISSKSKDGKTLKVLHLSDMHVDKYYETGVEADCGKPYCCRSVSNPNNGDKIKKESGYWGSLASCDLPPRTLEAMIKQIAEEIKPDLVLWTGDNGTHDVWKLSEETASISTHLIGGLLNDGLVKRNNITLVPAIGNHEEKDVDQFNPFNLTEEKMLLLNISEVYQNFVGEEKSYEFRQRGYFSYRPLKNLKVISFNCFLCDAVNFHLIKNPTDPLGQIDWLVKELEDSEKLNESVYIIGHIPPGEWSFLVECNKRYNAILDRFENIIKGQFFGHTHNDHIYLKKGYFDKDRYTGLVFTAPSTTTYSFLNPSFRYFEVDSESYEIKNMYQYRLDLEKANKDKDNLPKFDKVYEFNDLFKVSSPYDYKGIRETTENIMKDDTLYFNILNNYFSGGSLFNKFKDQKVMRISLYCRFLSDSIDEYWKCSNYKTCKVLIN